MSGAPATGRRLFGYAAEELARARGPDGEHRLELVRGEAPALVVDLAPGGRALCVAVCEEAEGARREGEAVAHEYAAHLAEAGERGRPCRVVCEADLLALAGAGGEAAPGGREAEARRCRACDKAFSAWERDSGGLCVECAVSAWRAEGGR